MGISGDNLLWKLTHEAVTRHDYQIIRLSEDEQEVLLGPYKNKEFQIVRFIRMDLDWGRELQQDIERTAGHIDRIRKQSWRHPIQLLNVYISSYPPVDEWEFRIEKPHQEGQTTIKSIVVHKDNESEMVFYLEQLLGVSLASDKSPDPTDIARLRSEAITYSNRRVKEERQIFNFGKPIFTYLFTGLQILMFMLLEAAGGSQNTQVLIQFGAKYNPSIINGEWWRFFTPIILHIGMLHLLMNTLALIYIGSAVERMYGSAKFLFIYLFAGAAGTLASFALSPSISAGASGAIFGCFGALLYLGIIKPNLFFRTIGSNLIFIIVLNLLFGFAVPNIDNAGHIGGLLGGFLAALTVPLPKQNKWGLRLLGAFLSILLIAGAYIYGIHFAWII
ncbi:rhomboid family intramembrane serine protease [Peribacillus frigoritolerans]|uniref:rhomboid family intramembrane serine protease n=1 Tax=Peribacillus frigoritolerans TaxID=450367 RepID=UPI001059DA5F|nr:rhomboid family intramembrane serine protease [Peribacillus frigoritolerans]TDL82300.1 rhomboid family intramembrane serine protease [Peribacillus frigoritolerans]